MQLSITMATFYNLCANQHPGDFWVIVKTKQTCTVVEQDLNRNRCVYQTSVSPCESTWKGVLMRLTRVSRMWTPSCWWRRMKERRVCSRAGSETLLRKRSRYAVVAITSSSVSCRVTEMRSQKIQMHLNMCKWESSYRNVYKNTQSD